MKPNEILKPDFIKLVAQDSGFTQQEVEEVYESILRVLARCLVSGKILNIYGFGKFYTTDIPPFEAYDAVRKQTYQRGASKRINFKISSTLRNLFKENFEKYQEKEVQD